MFRNLLGLFIIMLFAGAASGQKNFQDYYNKDKVKGIKDLKSEVKIDRRNLSGIGTSFADSLETYYQAEISTLSQMTKDSWLSEGVGRYFAEKDLKQLIDVYVLEENFRRKNSKYFDFDEFFKSAGTLIQDAERKALLELFIVINEACREPIGFEQYGNLECFAENIDEYKYKKEILDRLKNDMEKKGGEANASSY